MPQIVYYNSGVGSGGKVDQILGGVFGAGVRSNVQRGLTFLSFNYDDGAPDVHGRGSGDTATRSTFSASRAAPTLLARLPA